jgi:hypothetical protein
VKLPADTAIPLEKLTKYLLVKQARGDKSAFLATAGYTAANPQQLLHDLQRQVLSQEAVLLQRTNFGQLYEIRAALTGPNRRSLPIRSIWIREHLSGATKFITLVPDRRK